MSQAVEHVLSDTRPGGHDVVPLPASVVNAQIIRQPSMPLSSGATASGSVSEALTIANRLPGVGASLDLASRNHDQIAVVCC